VAALARDTKADDGGALRFTALGFTLPRLAASHIGITDNSAGDEAFEAHGLPLSRS